MLLLQRSEVRLSGSSHICNSNFKGSDTLWWPLQYMVCTWCIDICRQRTHTAKTNICFKVPGYPPCFQLPPLCAQPICQTAPKTCRHGFLTFTFPGEPTQAAGGHQRSTDREAGWGRVRTFYPFWVSCPESICVLSSPEPCPFGVCIRLSTRAWMMAQTTGGQERVLYL